DFMKRVLSRAVNKKSLESLAYSGSFDCFPEYHRAQYFNVPDGERSSGLEKLIGYAQAMQTMSTGSSNTLFGDLPSAMQVPIPKLTACEEWTLTEKLDHEKDITGMFMSGHPLDHFSFEMKHYLFTPINDFNEVKDMLVVQPNYLGKYFKLAGLITDVQHRITKTGKNFGSFVMEDFTGKTDFILWSEDYIKFQNYLEIGQKICINGAFRNRFNQPNLFEFKIQSMSLLETVKTTQTRSIEVSLHPANLRPDMISFFEKNIKENPGKSSFKFNFIEPKEQLVASLLTFDKGCSINDELVAYLDQNPELQVQVNLV
ncbi:MAG: OB-fold nucleic acid binding domain-containing protein, partial [Chitinophagaceae bacterium]